MCDELAPNKRDSDKMRRVSWLLEAIIFYNNRPYVVVGWY